jgi:polyribonucleotide nucleotidyltransferase
VQILAWVLSYSPDDNVDPIALVASSAALLASPIPFDTPIAGVAVGMDSDGRFIVNPTREALRHGSHARHQ